ncbi:MAG TPA: VIT domain-containing protein, partial [Planctomycetota bacterium]|nr:VIT domain-containing protein [Planctomycetota bacterium]
MERNSRRSLVLVAAVAVLAALAAVTLHAVNRRARAPERIGDAKTIAAALQEYLKYQGQTPASKAIEKPAADTAALGRVEIARGMVGLRDAHQPRWVLARADAPVEADRILRVGDDPSACARVALTGGIEISVNSTSTVEFAAKDRVAVLGGDAHFVVRAGTPLTVDAPACSIHVKGTEFSVTVVPGRTSLAVTAGTVELDALGKTFDVPAGKACSLTGDMIRWDDRAEAPAWLAKFEQLPAEESLGRLVAKIDGRDVPLAVKSHTVTVTIRDQIAYTQIEEEFENNTASRLEGTFYYPLPAEASISRFAMWVGNVLMEGEVVERMRAREVYESIVRRKRDPALLEWMGGNQFKARVFPIEPNSTKHVILGYTQVLPLEGDLVRYVYPLKSEKLTKNPLKRLQIELNVWSTPAMAGFDSPSHVCGLAADAHHGRAIFQAENYLPTRD